MADISKCKDETCPNKEKCWRFNAPSNELWQTYGSFGWMRDQAGGECKYFWEMKNGKPTGV